MREVIESFEVVGLPLRTSNREAARTIPAHWEAAAAAGLVGVPGPEAYAVYTDYETPFDVVSSAYTLIIGRRGEAIGPGRDDLVVARIPASARDVVVVSDSRPESIVEAWAGIWARQDLPRDYRADYECYAPDGSVRLSVGVLPAA